MPRWNRARASIVRRRRGEFRLSDAAFVEQLYRELLGRRPDEPALRHFVGVLAEGRERSDVAIMVATSEEFARLAARRLQDDASYIDQIYRELLGRPADANGLTHYVELLDEGAARLDLVVDLVRSEEYQHRVVRDHVALPDLKVLRPDRYRQEPTLRPTPECDALPVFVAAEPSDFDWLEDAILKFDYYERPGIWTLGVDEDKRLVADLLATLGPGRALELGCASGAVIQCLDDLGIYAEGVEISRSALRRAKPEIAARIHCVDLLEAELEPYDLIYGLDIFEHFNPNRLGTYLRAISDLIGEGGLLFANIPAFGPDPIFGEVFGILLDEWREAAGAGRNFSLLQVDDAGYPLHGHLIWASSTWWQEQFERVGLRREGDIERTLHQQYDASIERISIARKSFFVFSKQANPGA